MGATAALGTGRTAKGGPGRESGSPDAGGHGEGKALCHAPGCLAPTRGTTGAHAAAAAAAARMFLMVMPGALTAPPSCCCRETGDAARVVLGFKRGLGSMPALFAPHPQAPPSGLWVLPSLQQGAADLATSSTVLVISALLRNET